MFKRETLAQKIVWPILGYVRQAAYWSAMKLLRLTRVQMMLSYSKPDECRIEWSMRGEYGTAQLSDESYYRRLLELLVDDFSEPHPDHRGAIPGEQLDLIRELLRQRWNGGADVALLALLDTVMIEKDIGVW